MPTFVYDRTESDMKEAVTLAKKGYANMTSTEKAKYLSGLKGAMDYRDYNRLGEILTAMPSAILSHYGLTLPNKTTPKTDFDGTESITNERLYLNNLQANIRRYALKGFLANATYADINKIEKILYDLYNGTTDLALLTVHGTTLSRTNKNGEMDGFAQVFSNDTLAYETDTTLLDEYYCEIPSLPDTFKIRGDISMFHCPYYSASSSAGSSLGVGYKISSIEGLGDTLPPIFSMQDLRSMDWYSSSDKTYTIPSGVKEIKSGSLRRSLRLHSDDTLILPASCTKFGDCCFAHSYSIDGEEIVTSKSWSYYPVTTKIKFLVPNSVQVTLPEAGYTNGAILNGTGMFATGNDYQNTLTVYTDNEQIARYKYEDDKLTVTRLHLDGSEWSL